MQNYELQDLLQVRRLREDAAAREWAQQKVTVANAEAELARVRRELSDYQAWRIRREAEMFEEVMNQPVRPKELDDLRFRIQKLRDKESTYASRVIESEEQLRGEQEKLEEDRQAYFSALRNREKLDEHKALWKCDAEKLREELEERETEDFKPAVGCLTVGEGNLR